MTDRELKPATKLVEGGRRRDWRGRLVNPPVTRASTILFDSVAEERAAQPGLGDYYYALHGTPTQWALAEALTALEPGAAGTALFPSGLSAITTPLLAILKPGDELLVTDSVYRPTRRFCETFLKRFGVTTRYYDPLIGRGIADLIGEATRAILLESPGSQTMEVQDVPGISAVARERGIVTLLDNTWATPLLFPAMAAGVDISMVAATKYVGGHSDLMLGAATANEAWYPAVQRAAWDLGVAVSADDAWLALRGLRTMDVRLRQHEASALKIAHWLADQPQVERVLHPALPSCPGHDSWLRDFTGSSGLFSFLLRSRDDTQRVAFVERLRLFGIGYSWGGYESLVVVHDPQRSVSEAPPAGCLVRLQIGLEDTDDLIDDLGQALASVA